MLTKSEVEKVIGKSIVFEHTISAIEGDTFGAYHKATEWLLKRGIDSGSMQRHDPIGLARNAEISKWRNLGPDKRDLEGVMVSDSFREGNVTIYLSFNPETNEAV
jgi:hypothetical protein